MYINDTQTFHSFTFTITNNFSGSYCRLANCNETSIDYHDLGHKLVLRKNCKKELE